jgi:hypothetical protein
VISHQRKMLRGMARYFYLTNGPGKS